MYDAGLLTKTARARRNAKAASELPLVAIMKILFAIRGSFPKSW